MSELEMALAREAALVAVLRDIAGTYAPSSAVWTSDYGKSYAEKCEKRAGLDAVDRIRWKAIAALQENAKRRADAP